MELSEYYMLSLGGRGLFEENALETADAINQINPDSIRQRTLAISGRAPLFAKPYLNSKAPISTDSACGTETSAISTR